MRPHICLVTVLVMVLSASVGAAGEYRNDEFHFSLTIPNDWAEISRAELNAINARAAQRAPIKVEFIAGFRHTKPDFTGSPYILVQPLQGSIRGASYEELERSLERELGTSMKQAEGAIADLARNLKVGSAVLDRSRNQMVMRLQMDVVGGGRLQSLSVGHLGADCVIMVHAYAADPTFPRWVQTFDQINSTFRYDPGNTFNPGVARVGFWGNVGNGAMRGALIGGGVGLMAGLIALVLRTSKKKRPPRSFKYSDRFKDSDDE